MCHFRDIDFFCCSSLRSSSQLNGFLLHNVFAMGSTWLSQLSPSVICASHTKMNKFPFIPVLILKTGSWFNITKLLYWNIVIILKYTSLIQRNNSFWMLNIVKSLMSRQVGNHHDSKNYLTQRNKKIMQSSPIHA